MKYILNVTATDDNASGGPQCLSATAQIIVGVNDVNNNKPLFEKVQCLLMYISKPISLYWIHLFSIKSFKMCVSHFPLYKYFENYLSGFVSIKWKSMGSNSSTYLKQV